MNRSDKMISAAVLGLLPPVFLMLLFWWGSIPFSGGNNKIILFLALVGIAAGMALDATLLRRFLFQLFSLPLPALLGIELLYSVLVYGFFMGFPVFNSLVGICGAWLIARRAVLLGEAPEKSRPEISLVIAYSAVLLFLFCLCSAALALCEETICTQVNGMLGLPFEVTRDMIWWLILGGGGALMLFQIMMSRFVAGRAAPKGPDRGGAYR